MKFDRTSYAVGVLVGGIAVAVAFNLWRDARRARAAELRAHAEACEAEIAMLAWVDQLARSNRVALA